MITATVSTINPHLLLLDDGCISTLLSYEEAYELMEAINEALQQMPVDVKGERT